MRSFLELKLSKLNSYFTKERIKKQQVIPMLSPRMFVAVYGRSFFRDRKAIIKFLLNMQLFYSMGSSMVCWSGSFCSQTFYRIGYRSLNGLEADGSKCNKHRDQC